MAVNFGSANSSRYYTVPDHADFTLPDGDWSWVSVVKPVSSTDPKYIVSTNTVNGANSLNLLRASATGDALVAYNTETDHAATAAQIPGGVWSIVYASRIANQLYVGWRQIGVVTGAVSAAKAISGTSDGTSLILGGRNDLNTARMWYGAISWIALLNGKGLSFAEVESLADATSVLLNDFPAYVQNLWHFETSSDATITDIVSGRVATRNGTGYGADDADPLPYAVSGAVLSGSASVTVSATGELSGAAADATTFTAWLQSNDAIRCVLVDAQPVISGTPTNIKLSTRAYYDSVGGVVYDPIVIAQSLRTSERLSFNGEASLSISDLMISNNDGDNDGMLQYVWANTAITVYIGDARWPKADFGVLMSGIVDDVSGASMSAISISIKDKLERLNTSVTEAVLGGSTSNKDLLKPLCFGECFNISPLLTNPATLEYMVHDGPIERIIEVRDNGVPVAFTPSVATGTFTLAASPYGKITASVQGSKPTTWLTTTADIINRIVTTYGQTNLKFASGDIDTSAWSTFNTANQQAIGVYVDGRDNVLALCNRIANSIGAQLMMQRSGLLKLVKIDLPASGTAYAINTNHIITGTLKIVEKFDVQAGQAIGYVKNWTKQTGLETGIPAAHKDIFAREYAVERASDSAVKTAYKITSEPDIKETYMLTSANAAAEATRLLNLWKVPRYIYAFAGTPAMVDLQLGQPVTLTHNRFGLSATVGMVSGLDINWDTFEVNVEVFS